MGKRRTRRKPRPGASFFAGKPCFDSKRLALRSSYVPPCGMDADQLKTILGWLTYIAAKDTTSPVHTQIKLRAWFAGGSVFATSVDALLADPQFPGAARALDIRVYALTLRKRRRVVVECTPGRTRVRVLGEDRQWVRFAYHATQGVIRQQALAAWAIRNAAVGMGIYIIGVAALLFGVLLFAAYLRTTHAPTRGTATMTALRPYHVAPSAPIPGGALSRKNRSTAAGSPQDKTTPSINGQARSHRPAGVAARGTPQRPQ